MKRKRKLGRGVAIVGTGMSRFGMFRDKDSKDLFAEAFREMPLSVGKGTLVSFTCISIPPPLMMAEGYDRNHPYCSGVVELEEGGRVAARIEGVDPARPETISVGMPLGVKSLHRCEGPDKRTYLAFESF